MGQCVLKYVLTMSFMDSQYMWIVVSDTIWKKQFQQQNGTFNCSKHWNFKMSFPRILIWKCALWLSRNNDSPNHLTTDLFPFGHSLELLLNGIHFLKYTYGSWARGGHLNVHLLRIGLETLRSQASVDWDLVSISCYTAHCLEYWLFTAGNLNIFANCHLMNWVIIVI